MEKSLPVLLSIGLAAVKVSCFPCAMDSSVVVDDRGRVPDIICPGVADCWTAEGPLLVGVGSTNIDPVLETWYDLDNDGVRDDDELFNDTNGDGVWNPVWLAGFARGRAAQSQHDPLSARAISVRRGGTRLGLVAIDAIGLSHDFPIVLRRLAVEAGLGYDHIVVTTTHTHGGPDTLGFWGPDPLISGVDPTYLEIVTKGALAALVQAANDETAASLKYAHTKAPELVADSRLPRVIDQAMHVLQFNAGAQTIASLLVWGNHPEVLGPLDVTLTADYVASLRSTLEAAYPGSMALFVAGNLGGLMTPLEVIGCPDDRGIETCPNGTFDKADYIGTHAALAAVAALERVSGTTYPDFEFRRRSLLFQVTNPQIIGAYLSGVLDRSVYDSDGVVMDPGIARSLPPEAIAAGAARIQSEVNAVTLGPVTFLTIPGELYPELWLTNGAGNSLVERPTNADFPNAPVAGPLSTLVPAGKIAVAVNQANDSIGYLIPMAQWDEAYPFAYTPDRQYGETFSLGFLAARIVDRALRDLAALSLTNCEPEHLARYPRTTTKKCADFPAVR